MHQRSATGLEILRLSLSSLHGGYLQPKWMKELPDPVTGFPLRWEAAEAAAQTMDPQVTSQELNKYQAKRVAARRAGSSYAYDLPGRKVERMEVRKGVKVV